MESFKRSIPYQKNSEVEDTLRQLERLLGGVTAGMQFESNHPIVFIMGCARSGTTLLSQLLAEYTNWCYPTNLISRFYYEPYVGAMIQRLLVDLDEKGELLGGYKYQPDYTSDLGKTKGLLSPHEFWYYWRRFFKFGAVQQLDEGVLRDVDTIGFTNGLYAIQSVFQKPLFLKGMIMNWHIPFLSEIFPKARFVYVKRDVRYNAQSLLLARERFFGTWEEWYSFKPPEYRLLKEKNSEIQVVGQVLYTNKAIEQGLQSIESVKNVIIHYEDLCGNVSTQLNRVTEMIGQPRIEINRNFKNIRQQSRVKVDLDTWKAIEDAVNALT